MAKMGHFKWIKNQEKKWNENENYFEGKIQLEDGRELHIMLTAHEMEEAVKRNNRNPEDTRKDGFIQDLFD